VATRVGGIAETIDAGAPAAGPDPDLTVPGLVAL